MGGLLSFSKRFWEVSRSFMVLQEAFTEVEGSLWEFQEVCWGVQVSRRSSEFRRT